MIGESVAVILIQPAFSISNRVAREHWENTVEHKVGFAEEPYRSLLTDQQADELFLSHPEGSARFWGMVSTHNAKLDELQAGDPVLFTGNKQVLAIGEVGVTFRNSDFALELWRDDPDRGPWLNVYTLASFQNVGTSHAELRAALGYKEGGNFMGAVVVREPDKIRAVSEALDFQTPAVDQSEAEEARRLLVIMDPAEELTLPEKNTTKPTRYTRSERDIIMKRLEAVLVEQYRAQLAAEIKEHGMRIRRNDRRLIGKADLYTVGDNTDLIEAKSSSGHGKVREALGQILDYAHHVTTTPDFITALFPKALEESDQQLLHRYGVDIVFREDDGTFSRQPAPEENRAVWRKSAPANGNTSE
jgi:hypothetical protein